ncbi:MAG: 50S ribosomal protein L10 [Saprospiraceae bacterium]|nr:50S ribosomal protein L10 [Saprospiraceae bacterium]
MTRTEKEKAIKVLKKKFKKNDFFYLTDSSELSVEEVNSLRRKCFEKGVEMKVVKNTLAIKAMQSLAADRGFDKLYEALKGPTAIMFTETANEPAKIIKDFRKGHEKPVLKAAYIDSDIFIGDEHVDTLASLKSKEEVIGEIISLLESPIKSVIGALDAGSTIANLLSALEDRAEAS